MKEAFDKYFNHWGYISNATPHCDNVGI